MQALPHILYYLLCAAVASLFCIVIWLDARHSAYLRKRGKWDDIS